MSQRARRVSVLLAIVLACAVLLPMLGHRALTEWDEGVYAEISREMLQNGWRWVWVPHWNFQPWLEKPPLMFWVTAALYRVFGVSEFWARAGSAFAGITLVGVLHAWLIQRRGPGTAWMSSLLLLACLGFQHAARVGEVDVLLALGITVALIGIAEVSANIASGSRGWSLFWIGFAVAVMTKGAASAVLPISVVVLLTLRVVRVRREHWHAIATGAMLFLVLAGPWHVFAAMRFGPVFWHEYLGSQVLQRAGTVLDGHRTAWWYYAKVLFVSAGPTLIVAAFAVTKKWEDHIVRVFAVFAAVDLILFSVSRTRLPHYVAGVYPAMAVVGAVWCGPLVESLWRRGGSAFWRLAAAAVVLSAGLIAMTGGARKKLHAPVMTDGSVAVDNREETKLLEEFFGDSDRSAPRVEPYVRGPLLMWREKHLSPINTAIFYSGRPVQRVVFGATTDIVKDKYMFDPEPMEFATASGPRLLLADRSVLAVMPATFRFTEVAHSQHLVLGMIERAAN